MQILARNMAQVCNPPKCRPVMFAMGRGHGFAFERDPADLKAGPHRAKPGDGDRCMVPGNFDMREGA